MKTADEAGGIPKPLAAYRLGQLSRTFSMWQALFLEKPEFEWGTADGVLVVVEELNEPVVTLAAEIPVNVYGELRTWLVEQSERWTSVLNMVWEYHNGHARWNRQVIEEACKRPNPDLRALVDVDCEHLAALRPWFQLGVAVGEYEVLLHGLDESCPLPGVDGIVAAVHGLKEAARLHPVLHKLLKHASVSPVPNARAFLTQVMAPADLSSDSEIYGAGFDAFVVGNLVHDLDRAIQDSSGRLAWPEAGPPPDEQALKGLKPRWVKEQDGVWVGELRVGDRVLRRVRHLAKNLIPILDTFEEEGWPPAVYDPLTGEDFQRRHEAIRSLNEGLRLIRFRADGTNERIKWEWA